MNIAAALHKFAKSRRATAAMEFSIIVPLMLVLLAGTVEFGRAFQAYRATSQLASRYASTWADCSDFPSGTCNSILATYASSVTIQNLVPQLTSSQVSVRMMQFQMTGGAAPVTYAWPTGASLTPAELAVAQNAVATGQTGVVVTIAYTHHLTFFQSLFNMFFPNGVRTFTFTVAQDKN